MNKQESKKIGAKVRFSINGKFGKGIITKDNGSQFQVETTEGLVDVNAQNLLSIQYEGKRIQYIG